MEPGPILSILVVLVLLAAIGIGLRYLIPVLRDHLKGSFGSASGWGTLAGVYGTSKEPEGEILTRQSLVAGAVVYRYIVTAAIEDEGLYLRVGGPLPRDPILIPWGDFRGVESARLFWQKAALVSVGEPRVSTLTLPMSLYEKLRSRLPAQLAAFEAPTKPI